LVNNPDRINGKRVLVVEDGPTLTHGGMPYGAGVIAAKTYGAAEIVDPRPYASGTIKETFELYPDIGHLLPAMGYSEEQIHDLEKLLIVLIATWCYLPHPYILHKSSPLISKLFVFATNTRITDLLFWRKFYLIHSRPNLYCNI